MIKWDIEDDFDYTEGEESITDVVLELFGGIALFASIGIWGAILWMVSV